jgi:DNA-binding FadR family transcriptional regulator
MEAHLDDVEAFLAENETFHTLVAEAAGNELFSLFIGSLNWICDASPLGVEYPRVMREKVLADHVAICKAIADGDSVRAGETMARHISDFAKHLTRKYPHVVDAALRWDQVDP